MQGILSVSSYKENSNELFIHEGRKKGNWPSLQTKLVSIKRNHPWGGWPGHEREPYEGDLNS